MSSFFLRAFTHPPLDGQWPPGQRTALDIFWNGDAPCICRTAEWIFWILLWYWKYFFKHIEDEEFSLEILPAVFMRYWGFEAEGGLTLKIFASCHQSVSSCVGSISIVRGKWRICGGVELQLQAAACADPEAEAASQSSLTLACTPSFLPCTGFTLQPCTRPPLHQDYPPAPIQALEYPQCPGPTLQWVCPLHDPAPCISCTRSTPYQIRPTPCLHIWLPSTVCLIFLLALWVQIWPSQILWD